MGESRQELLAWLNNLLQLNVTKVEQCGTGAALCQVYDSIFQDLPMSRVKFNVNTEYAYLQNFKILQSAFTKHQIERPVPVESLVKCKMQDNLEFLQWTKRYWDQYYPGGDYDALARRKGAGGAPAASAPTPVSSRTSGAGVGATSAARRGTTPTTSNTSAARGIRQPPGVASAALMAENTQLKQTVEGLERERDFYFSKLRDIELLLQQAVDQDPEIEKAEDGLVKHIQAILYSTEEGFEIPAEAEGGVVDDQETF
ncbi:calponin homology domain-containing protein [Usnea florida]